MSNSIEWILLNRPSEIARLQAQLESLARQLALPPRVLHDVQLALEEHLSNILKCAYADQRDHEIKVRLSHGEIEFCVEVEDDGRAFNPLDYPEPDLSLPVDKRPVGGLGIHMIRKSMDRTEYRRSEGKNILVMFKRIKGPTP
jgi:anti-sigma regulatory factor (Ser/Thr protein kinase)